MASSLPQDVGLGWIHGVIRASPSSHRLVGELSCSIVDPGRRGVVHHPIDEYLVEGEATRGCARAVAVEAVLLEGLRGQGKA